MKKLFFVIFFIFIFMGTFSAQNSITVKSDPRVELLSIIFKLAGAEEYSTCFLPGYKADVENYFGSFKDHQAVKLAILYRETNGVSFDAVMSIAIHIDYLNGEVTARIPFAAKPLKLDSRWNTESGEKFVEALNAFVKETNFQKFYNDHADFYKIGDARLLEIVTKNVKLEWYGYFFGKRPAGAYILVPGYLTGGGNYGVNFKDKEKGIDEIYSITAVPMVDVSGLPVFNANITSTIIHEFCHSYVNDIVYKHIDELKNAGEKIFPFVEKQMASQAYSSWQTMMIESVVRACEYRYLIKNSTPEAAKRNYQYNMERGFIWMDDFVKIFDEYENNRNLYPGLDEFFPQIVKFFNDYSGKIKDKIDQIARDKEGQLKLMHEKGPKIVSIIPANSSSDVDPKNEFIIITFDREMNTKGMAVIRGTKHFPQIVSTPKYEEGNKIFKIKVKLEPDTEYEMWLNKDNMLGFKSTEDIPLEPTHVTFKTGK